MRWVTSLLVVVAISLQYPLWVGKGGWLRVWEVDQEIKKQRKINLSLQHRNAGFDAEVRDLKQGSEAIEERARYELGMIKSGEIFVQLPYTNPVVAPAGHDDKTVATLPVPDEGR